MDKRMVELIIDIHRPFIKKYLQHHIYTIGVENKNIIYDLI